MSLFAIEKVLWEICQNPECAKRYQADPVRYLAAYALDSEESRMIRSLDVRVMLERRVSPALTMRAWQVLRGRDQLPAYLRALAESA